MRQLDVEADEVVVSVEKSVRQRLRQIADAQRAARCDVFEDGSAMASGRRWFPVYHSRERCPQQIHAGQHAIPRIGLPESLREQNPRTPDCRECQHQGQPRIAGETGGLPTQRTSHGAGAKQRDHHRMHCRDERAEAGVDDTTCQEQLKGVGRNPKVIEQERHRNIEASKEGQDPHRR